MRQWLASDGMVIVTLDLSKALRFRRAVWAALEQERQPSDKAADAFTGMSSVLCEFYQRKIHGKNSPTDRKVLFLSLVADMYDIMERAERDIN
jgi:hypothetical protein